MTTVVTSRNCSMSPIVIGRTTTSVIAFTAIDSYARASAADRSFRAVTRRPIRPQARRHFAFIKATATSSMRLLNPHSLSYQLDTLTRRPETLVSVESNVDDAGSWLKSTDTSGEVL